MINSTYRKKIKTISASLIVCLSVPLLSYADNEKNSLTDKENIAATIIHFSDYEPLTGKNPVTMTITDKFLRIDDNLNQASEDEEADTGYILYDRQEKAIYSVSSDEKQIIKIKSVAVTMPSPIDLKLNLVQLPVDEQAPLVAGKKAQSYQLYVNEKLCYNLVSVPGLMPDVVTAMGDFYQVLAGQQAETLPYIPSDLHEACDLTIHTFNPKSHLKNGFPMIFQVHEQAEEGSTKVKKGIKQARNLVNFSQEKVSTALFVLPDYAIVPIN
ncbi:hypothetical protein [sulfur-oxidizing endosymbiont of Gigantopelta aegis]|uniref:hypothetical protein n=1 Tax=sulfur-oxidizing endosymbiont of Gigantopelta aegis TaxID=2794934 RepID=UPI0018DBC931|nr:hypothetical protein [sulfur-oxidizing endosymbiont of Gigantopelta aegis]